MHESSLAFRQIDAAVDAAVAREEQLPAISATAQKRVSKTGFKVVAGFSVNDRKAEKDAFNEAFDERKHELKKYRNDRGEITSELQERGVTPLAVLPKSAWERICKESGLYRLSPDRGGNVPISANIFESAEERALVSSFVLWVSILLSVTLKVGVVVFAPAIMGLLVLLGMLLGSIFGGQPYILINRVFTRFWLAAMCRSKSHSEMIKEVFPDGASGVMEERDRDSISITSVVFSARLVLPTPPREVEETLLKARDFHLKVAAVPEAIFFAETPWEIMQREHARRDEARRMGQILDPIIYCEHGSAVAVIAQFGDFPIEEQMVNEVANSEYLI